MKTLLLFKIILLFCFGLSFAKDENETNSTTRIVFGKKAVANQFPWQVALIITQNDGSKVFCGGSIIANNWILTAAHCAENAKQFEVRYGVLSKDDVSYVRVSSDFIVHESFDQKTLQNDITLIRLALPVDLNGSNVQTIRLPSKSQATEKFAHMAAIVSGWGAQFSLGSVASTLNYAHMKTLANWQCAIPNRRLPFDSVICARGALLAFLQNACYGDSGGPLIINEQGTFTQIGIVSYGTFFGCEEGFPSAYTRTSYYLDWINSHTGIPIRQ